jgi:twitching motility two-component system response regulator PilH
MAIGKVLVVDDSQTDTKIVSDMLIDNGYDVVTAGNAEEGLLKAREEHPDCILMDVVMPGMNGLQATRFLSRDPDTSAIPVVIISSKGMETDKVWASRQGAVDYIVKPVSAEILMDKLRTL